MFSYIYVVYIQNEAWPRQRRCEGIQLNRHTISTRPRCKDTKLHPSDCILIIIKSMTTEQQQRAYVHHSRSLTE